MSKIRRYFLTGFVITAPLVITLYLIWTLVEWVDSWIIPYVPAVYNPDTYLPFHVPGAGFLIAMFLFTIVGFLTANFVGKSIVSWGEGLLSRMPVVRNLYNGLKQIFQTVLSDKTDSFKQVGLLEYPRKGLWAIVFIATETKGEVDEVLKKKGKETLSIFLPTTPNPTSGFLLFVPKDEIIILDQSVEDAAKLVISAGLVTPDDHQAELQALVDAAKEKANT
ncbi:MAG: DUF502 domain-containing protein [Nitratireductor sp.]